MKPGNGNGAYSPSEVLRLLSHNKNRIVLVSPTSAYLPGLENWVGKLDRFVLTDSLDGYGAEFIASTGLTTQDFSSGAEAANFLSEAAQASAGSGQVLPLPAGPTLSEGSIFRVLEEARVASLGTSISQPVDYADFRKKCRNAGLSFAVDVFPAEAAPGAPPLAVTSEEDWQAALPALAGQDLVCLPQSIGPIFAMECFASATGVALSFSQRACHDQFWGTSRWSCLSNGPNIEPEAARSNALIAQKAANALVGTGYSGTFSVETEVIDGKAKLRRVTPGFSQYSLIAHIATSIHGGFPLHVLHIAQAAGLCTDFDFARFKGKFTCTDTDQWSVLAIRHIGSAAEMITRAPASGLYMLRDGEEPLCVSQSASLHAALGADQGYFLRLQGAGNYRAPGSLLGLLYVRDACMDAKHHLNPLGQRWIDSIYAGYAGLPVSGSSLPKGITALPNTDIL